MLELDTNPNFDLTISAVQHGVGLFETIRLEGGRTIFLSLHLERLSRALAYLGLAAPPPTNQVREFIAAAVATHGINSGVVKLIAADNRLVVLLKTIAPSPPGSVEIMVSPSVARFSQDPFARMKTLSYLPNFFLIREAESSGVFESVALNERDELTDGGRTNIFLIRGNDIFTPPTDSGCLPGIVRQLLLGSRLVKEHHVTTADLAVCQTVFLTNSLREIVPVHAVRGIGRKDPANPLLDQVIRFYQSLKLAAVQ